ncbi:MAG TPA: hypothetical protein VGD10_01880 [Allosphingosinicella sp.]|uniref:hypothetical protein n=1 Tax=Allosphingosinicella sp. TaxID=2823234 RepID=UPI002EDB1DDF
MPANQKLKVFRTPIGFHDAYVAAPSQKAAIEAWGTDKDVFARGQAELVTDPALAAEPLASPGTVIKRLRGTAAEQIAALGDTPPPPRRKAAEEAEAAPAPPKAKPKPPPRPKPKPSRAALDEAEAALTEAEARQKQGLNDLAQREAALARERRALEKAQADETAGLARARDKAEAAYRDAMRRWRG